MYAVVERGTPVPPSRSWPPSCVSRSNRGELPANSALPSIVTLSQEHHLATNTVRKALAILRAEGLIHAVPGYGTFVSAR